MIIIIVRFQVQTVSLVLKVKEVLMVSLDPPEVQGSLDQLDNEATLVHKVPLVPEGHKEAEEILVVLDQTVRQGHRDNLVCLDL